MTLSICTGCKYIHFGGVGRVGGGLGGGTGWGGSNSVNSNISLSDLVTEGGGGL